VPYRFRIAFGVGDGPQRFSTDDRFGSPVQRVYYKAKLPNCARNESEKHTIKNNQQQSEQKNKKHRCYIIGNEERTTLEQSDKTH